MDTPLKNNHLRAALELRQLINSEQDRESPDQTLISRLQSELDQYLTPRLSAALDAYDLVQLRSNAVRRASKDARRYAAALSRQSSLTRQLANAKSEARRAKVERSLAEVSRTVSVLGDALGEADRAARLLAEARADADYLWLTAPRRADAGQGRDSWPVRLERWRPAVEAVAERLAYDPDTGVLTNVVHLRELTADFVRCGRHMVPRAVVSWYLHTGQLAAVRRLHDTGGYEVSNLVTFERRARAPGERLERACMVPTVRTDLDGCTTLTEFAKRNGLHASDAVRRLDAARAAGHRAYLVGDALHELNPDGYSLILDLEL